MPNSNLERIRDDLSQTLAKLGVLRRLVEECADIPIESKHALANAIDRSETDLLDGLGRVRAQMGENQMHRSIERAWQLVALYEIGALDQDSAYELTQHTPHDVQERLNYPSELQAKLRDGPLILSVLDRTMYTLCVAGRFFN